jgi:ribose-phosphate pyrophosphokinase
MQAQGREAITAKLAANLLTEAGSDRIIVCDIHSTQALGYFDIPVDHIHGQVTVTEKLLSLDSTMFQLLFLAKTFLR